LAFLLILVSGGLVIMTRFRRRDSSSAERRGSGARQAYWRLVTAAVVLSPCVGLICAAIYGFVPVPYLENVVTETAWQKVPLRLTALQFERTYDGFTLEGEVWNQTGEPLAGLRARVEVVATDDKPLAELLAEIVPNPLDGGRPGVFQTEYHENSPFIKGYRVSFVDAQGAAVLHLTGFDVQ